MGGLSTGGGSGAVAASSHAGCGRHRKTDPLVIGRSRRKLAEQLGSPDTSAGIPEARWMRAMTFERLVEHERFVSRLLTTAVGTLRLARPAGIRRADCRVSTTLTAEALDRAHDHAIASGEATMLTALAVPFIGMEATDGATPVKPDFAIVAPRTSATDPDEIVGSWLIMGDAKDYERVRSRIDDPRLLRGFLQVALGAESASAWSKLPAGMAVHAWGALAVPRNAFLQPEALVENLEDHRAEVRTKAEERAQMIAELEDLDLEDDDDLATFVAELEAAYDPRTCVSCALFDHCRTEVRNDGDPAALLVELGVRPEIRPALEPILDAEPPGPGAPASAVAGLKATLDGMPVWTGQRRVDPIGRPGTVNVVLAKADAAALGIHGIGISGASTKPTEWDLTVFDDPQSPTTRTGTMEKLGRAIDAAMSAQRRANPNHPGPVHLITPDTATADLLVSIADSLAGTEISRLQWEHDVAVGRTPLTFDGSPATIPKALSARQRLAVSFLLEEDRARAMSLRTPVVDARSVLAEHLVPGGPGVDAGRLDYLVRWAEATTALDHRAVSDEIADSVHTPGARLSNTRSDQLHVTRMGRKLKQGRSKPKLEKYRTFVEEELRYKAEILDRACAVLGGIADSNLLDAHRALERDAQAVWRRRLELHASDLVRFGRTQQFWRNQQVELLDADRTCGRQLSALGNPQAARDMALDAGTRDVGVAIVTSLDPIQLDVRSRRIGPGKTVIALTVNGVPTAEGPAAGVLIQGGSFKLDGLAIGELSDPVDHHLRAGSGLVWEPTVVPVLAVGDELDLADAGWFASVLQNGRQFNVKRPARDTVSAPKDHCDADSYQSNPSNHQWCCRPHELAEAEWADILAQRRARGEMNPETWPPLIDEERFDVAEKGMPTATSVGDPDEAVPAHLTIDDLD